MINAFYYDPETFEAISTKRVLNLEPNSTKTSWPMVEGYPCIFKYQPETDDWLVIPDYRNYIIISPTGEEIVWTELGELPEGYTVKEEIIEQEETA